MALLIEEKVKQKADPTLSLIINGFLLYQSIHLATYIARWLGCPC